jgi:hypothetical protein
MIVDSGWKEREGVKGRKKGVNGSASGLGSKGRKLCTVNEVDRSVAVIGSGSGLGSSCSRSGST